MLSLRIALRYLLAPKSHAAVNVISLISVAAIAMAAAAMVIVMSVFNGFERLSADKLSRIDPDFLLVPSQGKHLDDVDALIAHLEQIPGVAAAVPQITEQAFATFGDRQMPVRLRGVAEGSEAARRLRDITIDGAARVDSGNTALSVGVAMGLGCRPSTSGETLEFNIYEPRRRGRINPANPAAAFRQATLTPAGVFQVEQEQYDRDMVIVPLEQARELLDYTPSQATEIAIYLAPGVKAHSVAKSIQSTLATPLPVEEGRHVERGSYVEGDLSALRSPLFTLQDRQAQQADTFRMIAVEKWVTFLMLAFILVIASFGILSAMSMLIIEKRGNLDILRAMGMRLRSLRGVFLQQSAMITLLGGIAGIAVGTLLALGQQTFGWIRLGGSDPSVMSIEVYPVAVRWADLPPILGAIMLLSLLTSLLTLPLTAEAKTAKRR